MRGRRCVEGRLFRHDAQIDDPNLETDVGECPDCRGKGCDGEATGAAAESSTLDVLRELNRVKVLFQARAVAAAMGLPQRVADAKIAPQQKVDHHGER